MISTVQCLLPSEVGQFLQVTSVLGLGAGNRQILLQEIQFNWMCRPTCSKDYMRAQHLAMHFRFRLLRERPPSSMLQTGVLVLLQESSGG